MKQNRPATQGASSLASPGISGSVWRRGCESSSARHPLQEDTTPRSDTQRCCGMHGEQHISLMAHDKCRLQLSPLPGAAPARLHKWGSVVNNKILYPFLASLLTVTALAAAPVVSAAPSPKAAPNASIKVLDSANAINDPAWFSRAYTDGFRLYVMHSTAWGTCTPGVNTEAQLGMAVAAGLKIAVYTRDPNCWQAGISAAGQYKSQLQFFALDVEHGGPVVTRAMVDGVQQMGVRPVIYTGSGMWAQMTNNSTEFSDVPLWDTDVRNIDYSLWVADYLSPTPVVYGGWNTPTNMRVGVQQKFEHSLNGVDIDLNSFDAGFLK